MSEKALAQAALNTQNAEAAWQYHKSQIDNLIEQGASPADVEQAKLLAAECERIAIAAKAHLDVIGEHNAKQVSQASPLDGGVGAQSSLRKEGGGATEGSEGV